MAQASSQQGTIVGDRYVLREIIGRGGMADVFRATDQVREQDVAVKLLRQPDPADADHARFITEAKTLSSLNHSGLVTVLDVNSDHDRLYLVMELVAGQPLNVLIQEAPIEPHRLAEMGYQLADALGYVHQHGIVHRDIKPANILVGKDDEVSLADFGIARILGDLRRHTETGFTMGTAAYVSPEQAQGHHVTGATDVYSLGLVLLEALTGEPAFNGTAAEVSLARLAVQPFIPESVDPAWREILQHMTAIEPSARPAVGWVKNRMAAITPNLDGNETTLLTPRPTLPPTTPLPAVPSGPVATKPLPSTTTTSTKPLEVPAPGPTPSTPTGSSPSWWKARPMRAMAATAIVVVVIALGYFAFGPTGTTTDSPDVPGKIGDDLQRLHDVIES